MNFNKYDPKFNVEDRARKLALKALGYSTVLTGAFFLGSIAVVGIYFNVTSLRQFSDKMVEIGPDAMGGPVQESIEKPFYGVSGHGWKIHLKHQPMMNLFQKILFSMMKKMKQHMQKKIIRKRNKI